MSEARTIREARDQIREVEAATERVHMAPATALSWSAGWYLRKARLALRQAERAFAKAEDPRAEKLEPLSPHLGRRRSRLPARKRYRCSECFTEELIRDANLEGFQTGHGRRCSGVFEPVSRLTRRSRRSAASPDTETGQG